MIIYYGVACIDILSFILAEENNYIRINPGLEVDDYNVTLKAHIYDIFIDYAECIIDVGPVCLLNLGLNVKITIG